MLCYELQDELLASSNKPEADGPVRYEQVINGCSEFHHIDLLGPLTLFTDLEHILHPPYKIIHAMVSSPGPPGSSPMEEAVGRWG